MTNINSNSELLSIIIPVYNSEKYLSECLDSVVKQSYKNIEIIIVDDGSIDNSYKICLQYASKHKNIKILKKKNGGVSSARNFALNYVNGKYISFLDSDDFLNLNVYKNTIKEFKDVDLVTFNWYRLYKNTLEFDGVNSIENINNITAMEKCVESNNSFQGYLWNKIFLTEIIQKNNIRFDENISICEDILFVTEYLKNSLNIRCLNQPYYYYRMRSSSISKKFNLNKQVTMLNAYEKLLIIWKKYSLKNKYRIEYLYNYIYFYNKKLYVLNHVKVNKKILSTYWDLIKNNHISIGEKNNLLLIRYCIIIEKIMRKIFKTNNKMFD